MSGIDRLRRLADEAWSEDWYEANDLVFRLDAYESADEDAAYIAAMNPEVGRALLDVVDAVKQMQAAKWGPAFGAAMSYLNDSLEDLDALLDEQEQA